MKSSQGEADMNGTVVKSSPMRGRVLLVFITVFLAVFFLAACTRVRTEAIVPSTFLVQAGTGRIGTAISLGEGRWLTKNHVVVDVDDVWLFANPSVKMSGKVIRRDEELDLALIESDTVAPSVALATESPHIWDPVYLYGHLGKIEALAGGNGHVKALNVALQKGTFTIISGGTYSGMSGSGVYNENMELIGIVDSVSVTPVVLPMFPARFFGIVQDPSIGMVTPVETIRKFLQNE